MLETQLQSAIERAKTPASKLFDSKEALSLLQTFRKRKIKNSFLWKECLEVAALEISKNEKSLIYSMSVATQMNAVQLYSPQIYGLIMDRVAQANDTVFTAVENKKLALLAFTAIGKNLDSNLKQKASLKVLTDRIIPDFLTQMLKQDKIEAENVLLALDMFKFYQSLPESLKEALAKKKKSF